MICLDRRENSIQYHQNRANNQHDRGNGRKYYDAERDKETKIPLVKEINTVQQISKTSHKHFTKYCILDCYTN
jgi:hypothetical protein